MICGVLQLELLRQLRDALLHVLSLGGRLQRGVLRLGAGLQHFSGDSSVVLQEMFDPIKLFDCYKRFTNTHLLQLDVELLQASLLRFHLTTSSFDLCRLPS